MINRENADEQLQLKIELAIEAGLQRDINAVMRTEEGRRFFSWIILKCGQDCTSFTRDSRTYFNEGMRNVALMLESRVKALGLNGVDLMHQAEKEFIIYRDDLKQQVLSKNGKKP